MLLPVWFETPTRSVSEELLIKAKARNCSSLTLRVSVENIPHAKSPARTSTQVTAVDQVVQRLVVKVEPLEMPVHQPPVCSARPVMSDLPSPLKSPTCTSTQVTAVDQVDQRLLLKVEPLEMAAHHWPVSDTRPMMSSFPSPLKSPTLTSTQVTAGFQVVQREFVKLDPVD